MPNVDKLLAVPCRVSVGVRWPVVVPSPMVVIRSCDAAECDEAQSTHHFCCYPPDIKPYQLAPDKDLDTNSRTLQLRRSQKTAHNSHPTTRGSFGPPRMAARLQQGGGRPGGAGGRFAQFKLVLLGEVVGQI